MKYNFSLEKLVIRRIPWALRKPNRVAWIKVLYAYLFKLNGEFRSFIIDTKYKLHINGRKIYLERYLNDLFDDTQRRIYINTNQLPSMLFTFKKQELPGFYIAHYWSKTISYHTDDIVNYEGIIYKALDTNTGMKPANYPSLWEPVDDAYYLNDADYINTYDFTIVFPASITMNSELERRIKALVNPYVVAGKNYNIIN